VITLQSQPYLEQSNLSDLGIRLLLVLVFILISALFAATEIAVVSLRESQLQQISTRGRRGKVLAELAENPTRFLAAVQVGITFASFIGAGLGASEIAPLVAPELESLGLTPAVSETVSFVAITILVAYVSLVIGELVPKRIAIQKAEAVALAFVLPISFIVKVTSPFIALLTASTNVVLRILGIDPNATREAMSGDELRDIVAGHEELTAEERELIDEVFEAQGRELREVMQPRTDVEFLDGELPVYKAAKLVSDMPHSRYPVIGESPDDILGFVHIRDIFNPQLAERSIRLADLVRELPAFPGTKLVIPTLSEMRRTRIHMAVVADEYGGTAGIVTLEDLVEELIGDIRDEYDEKDQELVHGELVIDGGLSLEDFEEMTGVELPDGPYETVAGYVVAAIGELPEIGQVTIFGAASLTILEVENRRASRIKVDLIEPETEPED